MEKLRNKAFELLGKSNFLEIKEKEIWKESIIPQMSEEDLVLFIANLEKRMALEKEYLETLKTKYLKAQGILRRVDSHVRFKAEESDRIQEMADFQGLEKELNQV